MSDLVRECARGLAYGAGCMAGILGVMWGVEKLGYAPPTRGPLPPRPTPAPTSAAAPAAARPRRVRPAGEFLNDKAAPSDG